MKKQGELLEAPMMESRTASMSRNHYSGEELMTILEPQIRAMFR